MHVLIFLGKNGLPPSLVFVVSSFSTITAAAADAEHANNLRHCGWHAAAAAAELPLQGGQAQPAVPRPVHGVRSVQVAVQAESTAGLRAAAAASIAPCTTRYRSPREPEALLPR